MYNELLLRRIAEDDCSQQILGLHHTQKNANCACEIRYLEVLLGAAHAPTTRTHTLLFAIISFMSWILWDSGFGHDFCCEPNEIIDLVCTFDVRYGRIISSTKPFPMGSGVILEPLRSSLVGSRQILQQILAWDPPACIWAVRKILSQMRYSSIWQNHAEHW